MTPELRAAYVAAVQAGAGDMYYAERETSGAARFVHVAQGFEATLSGAEVRLISQHAPWEISLATVGVGCDEESEIGLPTGEVKIAGNRVEISRADLREWYVNGPLGLEQGFTLERAPSCNGAGVVVTVEVGGGVVPALSDADGDGRGDAIVFSDSEGVAVARYTDLFVVDATGKRLSAWMSVRAGNLSLHVDDAGAAYPLQIDPLIWVQQAKLTASDGAANDFFGFSVALSGDTALVGVPYDDIGANVEQGSAYVFTRSGGVWTQQQKLTASDGAASDVFGGAVALSGDTALVAAGGDDVGANMGQGSAYVFTRSGVVWTEQQKLTASDGVTNDYFGGSVALSGDTALVAAVGDDIGANEDQGSAYVFTRSGVVWTEQQKLTASDGAAYNYFGNSVALSGDTALVGAYWHEVGANLSQGAAYVFTRSGVVWTEQQELTASDGAEGDEFGFSVALSGDTALVGSHYDDVGANDNQGSAYVFTRSGVVWTQQQKLTASDGVVEDQLGATVALLGDMAVAGAVYRDIGANENQGSVYVFTRSGGVWTQQPMLTVSNGAAFDLFGNSVALSGNTVLAGALYNDISPNMNEGAAYVFVLNKGNGDVCAANTDCASGFCVDGVCCNTACGGGNSADCQACSVAAGAAMNGTCAPITGTTCNDGNACTQTDTCQSGTCAGANPVVCAAMDQCHDVGTCDSATGMCSNPAKADGTTCNDGNACTQTDTCLAGACAGANPVVCAAMDQCHDVGTCDSATGLCSNPTKADGTTCNDGDACTQTDTCLVGACAGANPVVCAAMDQCHDVGTCDSATGLCSNPAKADGATCNDGDACTQADSCQSGVCSGADPVKCTAMDECHDVGTCEMANGMCSNPAKADGTACTNGTCQAGSCKVEGAGGGGGTDGGAGSTADPGSCGCRVVGSEHDDPSSVAFAGLALAATTMLRRRRRTRG